MDAMMYIWREKTSLRRWNIDRVAFMNAMFCLQIEKEYEKCNHWVAVCVNMIEKKVEVYDCNREGIGNT
uniref:Ubiquitin-like protease family profile domain-containing protein n=1 Tax=Brassica oleracea TaxID=3712 RepID=A0A3P6GEY1_BRAOL|nr:unnamed protein product [Brassica oleracea]